FATPCRRQVQRERRRRVRPMPSTDNGEGVDAEGRVAAAAAEERASRSVTFAFLAQMVGAVLTAVLTVFLGRALSASQFGDFTFALSVVLVASLFADLGVTSSSGRFVAERRGDRPAAMAVFRTSFWLKILIGVPASVALFALATPLCKLFGLNGAVWAVRGSALALLAQSLFLLLLGTFTALGMLRYTVVLATIESVSETLATFALVLLGAGATGAAFGRAIGYVFGLAGGIVVTSRALGAVRR